MRRLDSTEGPAQPDGVLVLSDPGIFVFGNMAATGSDALMMFVGLIINYCTALISTRFDFQPYIDWKEPLTNLDDPDVPA